MIPHYLVGVLLISVLLGAVFYTEAQAMPMHVEEKNFPLTVSERVIGAGICGTRSLDPATGCGCYHYSPLYLKNPKWRGLKDMCLDRLFGNIELGYYQCIFTTFAKSSGGVIGWQADAFFREARNRCAYRSFSVRRYDPSSIHSLSSLASDHRHSAPPKFSRPGAMSRPSVPHIKIDGDMDTALFQPSSDVSSTSRIPTETVKKRLSNLCLVMATHMGKSKRNAFRLCCPDL